MALQKNVSSQKWRVFAFNKTNGNALVGDAANITAKIAKDWATAVATNDVNPTETEDGYYDFDLTQAETNADALDFFPESSTSNIQVIGVPGSQSTRALQTGDSFARLGTPAGASIAADLVVIDDFVDDIEGVTGNLPDGGQLNDLAIILVDTANMQPKLGTPAADLAADIAAVKVDTAAVLVDTADMQPKLGTPAADLAADVAAVKVDTAATLVDTADIQPKIGTPAADLAADVAAVKVDTAATLVDTADIQPKIGTPAADLAADVAAVKTVVDNVETDTQNIQGRIPAALAGGKMDSDMTAISGDSVAADRLEALMDGTIIGQVNDAAATITAFAADGFTEATDDHFKGRLITFISGALNGQQTDITGYDAAGGPQGSQEFTVTALTEAPADDDFFVIH